MKNLRNLLQERMSDGHRYELRKDIEQTLGCVIYMHMIRALVYPRTDHILTIFSLIQIQRVNDLTLMYKDFLKQKSALENQMDSVIDQHVESSELDEIFLHAEPMPNTSFMGIRFIQKTFDGYDVHDNEGNIIDKESLTMDDKLELIRCLEQEEL